MNRKIAGKRVLITGASSGLGKACVLEFARQGAAVLLASRSRTRLVNVQKSIKQKGIKSVLASVDLRDVHDIELLADIAFKEFGGIDILINNAGAYFEGTPLIETSLADWTSMLNTNLRAPYLLCRKFVPSMISQRYGRIVNVTSATKTLYGVGAFRISKIALEVMSSVLSAELVGTGVTATAFNPGWMKTGTSLSGRSPRRASIAITDLVQRDSNFLRAACIDLVCAGKHCRLRKRRRGRGQFGLH